MIRSTLKRLDDSGAAAAEFALVLPFLLLLLFATITLGTTLYRYEVLTGAIASGARQFAVSRGTATPMTTTKTMISAGAPGLKAADLALTFSVSGVSCTTDTSCAAALQNGVPATIAGTYPCNLTVMGVDFAPGCQLSMTSTVRVE